MTRRPEHAPAPGAGGWSARLGAWVDRHPLALCLAFCGATIGVRLLLLLGFFEFIDFEELEYGELAKDMASGRLRPVLDYAGKAWEGGAHPVNLLVYPFYAALGPSLLALKLAGITLSTLGLVPWVELARRVGGPLAGVAAALLLCLAPPFYQRMTFSPMMVSTHLGTALFSGLALLLTWRGFVERSLAPGRAALALGLCAGLGGYWALSFWPLAVGLAATLALLRPGRRQLLLAGAGLLPGLLLLWLLCLGPMMDGDLGRLLSILLSGDFAQLVNLGGRTSGAGNAAQHLLRLVTVHFPRMAGFVEGEAHQFVAWPSAIYYALTLGAALWLGLRALSPAGRRGGEGRPLLLLGPAMLSYLAFYLGSGLDVESTGYDRYRYFLPVFPFALALLALAVGSLCRRAGRLGPWAGAAALAGLLALGLSGAANLFNRAVFPAPYAALAGFAPLHDVWYPLYGLRMPGRLDHRLLALRLGAEKVLLAAGMADTREPDGFAVQYLAPALRPDYWEGMGEGIRRVADPERAAQTLRGLVQEGPAAQAEAVMRGLGEIRGWATFHGEDENARRELQRVEQLLRRVLQPLPAARRAALLREVEVGVGQADATHAVFNIFTSFMGRPNQAYLTGLARGFAHFLLPGRPYPDGARFPSYVQQLAEPQEATFRRWVHAEQGRLEALRRRFARRAPYPWVEAPR